MENSKGLPFGTISLVDDDPVAVKKVAISGTDAVYFTIGVPLTLAKKSLKTRGSFYFK